MTVPQSSMHQWSMRVMKPVSTSTSRYEACTPLVKAKGYLRGT